MSYQDEVVPEFAKWINPLLRCLRDMGGSARPQEVVERIAKSESVADDVLNQLNPAGGQRFSNQVHWARYYLAEAGLIDRSKHGVWKLTEKGASTGNLTPQDLIALTKSVQISVAMKGTLAAPSQPLTEQTVQSTTDLETAPDEVSQPADYRSRLMAVLRTLSPAGFERLCQRLLREAGFEQVTVTGKSNDGGIDGNGVLAINHFVSFRVLFQCKRYAGSVSPAQVRDFRGAMQGRADKGMILTTGSFTVEARREAARDGAPPIELVDGERLIDLFAKLELGLIPVQTFDVDDSFFNEYR